MNSFYKRRFALLLIISIVVIAALTIVAAIVGVNMFGYDFEGEGTEESPYLISSDSDMKALSVMSSTTSSTDTEGKFYKLTRDVKIYGADRTKDLNGFAGTLDGDGHTVEIIGAMFNKLTGTAVIKNATLRLNSRVDIDDNFGELNSSYIAHYGMDSRIENSTVDYTLDLYPEPGTGKNKNPPTLDTLARYGTAPIEFRGCEIKMHVTCHGGFLTNRTVILNVMRSAKLRGSTADVTVDAEFCGVSTVPTFNFSCNASDSKISYTVNLIDCADEKFVESFDESNYTFDYGFSHCGYSLEFGKFHEDNDYKVRLNTVYDGRVDCFGAVSHDYDSGYAEGVDFGASVVTNNVTTFTKDGFTFAERGDSLYLLEYTGDGEEVVVPSFGGKYAAYCINPFAFLNKRPTKVVYPADVTKIGGKPYADNLKAIEFGGTMEQYKAMDNYFNRPPHYVVVPVKCSDGTYRFN